ncbi:MAG: sugar transferase [Acidobacteriaceae bacterium]|nr:sugar transferase [Acidobacteriaceae bacterium]
MPSIPVSRSNATTGATTPLVRRMCASPVRMADLAALLLALGVTFFSSILPAGRNFSEVLALRVPLQTLLLCAALLATWRLTFWVCGLHQPRLNRTPGSFLWRVPVTVAVCALPLLPVLVLTHGSIPEVLRSAFVFWFTGTTLFFATRAAYYSYDAYVSPSFRQQRNVLVIGTGPRARAMTLALSNHSEYRYMLAGFVDSEPQNDCGDLGPVLGTVQELEQLLMRQPIDEVLIALPMKSRFSEIQDVMSACGSAGVQTQYSLDLFNTAIAKHHGIDESTGARVVEMVHNDQRLYLKSALDRIFAFLGVVLLSPVFLAIAVAIKLESKGPVFFVQKRWGRNKRTFGMFKFRSMVVDAEARMAELEKHNELGGPMFKMKNDPRVTRVGNFIRKTSLDELPQLLNVLLGDMSLVGPRPLPTRDVERFSDPWAMRRFSVKPGITGLWQVSGRSNTDFDQTIQLDLRYIDRWSLLLDAKILFRTFAAVVKRSGAY